MPQDNGKGTDKIDEEMEAQIRSGGQAARNIVFGVAQANIREGRMKEALQWLKGTFYSMPEEDQRHLLIQLIAKYPADTVQ